MKQYRAICFDFDYTLGDSTDSIVAGFQYGFEKLGHPIPDRETVRGTIGYLLEDAYTLLTGDEDGERRAQFRAYFLEVAKPRQREETTLFPGAAELLRELHSRGVRLGIVSTKSGDTIEYIMNRYGLGDCLEVILGSYDVTRHKPHPEGILTRHGADGGLPGGVSLLWRYGAGRRGGPAGRGGLYGRPQRHHSGGGFSELALPVRGPGPEGAGGGHRPPCPTVGRGWPVSLENPPQTAEGKRKTAWTAVPGGFVFEKSDQADHQGEDHKQQGHHLVILASLESQVLALFLDRKVSTPPAMAPDRPALLPDWSMTTAMRIRPHTT